jgi:hypothetical protein
VVCVFERVKRYRQKFPEKHNQFRSTWTKKRRSDAGWAKNLINCLKYTARTKNIHFDLTSEQILALVPADKLCPVLGIPLVFGERADGTASVDRITPALGYVNGNVAIISLRANVLKRDCTDANELRKVADYIARTRG